MNRFQFRKNLLAGLLTPFLVVACTSVASTDIKTAGITANLTVTGNPNGSTTVDAPLDVDTNATDTVQVTGGDTLTAKAGSQSQPMTATDLLGGYSYSAAFSGEDDGGTVYTVSFNRTSDVSAPNSTVTMPAPIAISSPASSASFSRATGNIVVDYSPSGGPDPVSWTLGGACINQAGTSLTADPGTFTIVAGSVTVPTGTTTAPGSCSVTLTISRTRTGTIDPAYEGGSINATQTQSVSFISTP